MKIKGKTNDSINSENFIHELKGHHSPGLKKNGYSIYTTADK